MTDPVFADSSTLGAARTWLREQARGQGARCPCCTQRAQVYRRRVYSTMARNLIRCFRVAPIDYFHMPTVLGINGGDTAKLEYWWLITEDARPRDDGGRAGYWRVTALGAAFILRGATIPKYALIYDGRCLALEGEPVTIQDCLGTKFRLDELMAGNG